ncbi:hypothetical protein L873DRAFT_1812234 [Choiromyces venosus 120613-1]|uniref:MADS-box domain-containing protein n=1 Tax=Choiromyces venosus 120613-1 TaxID=1336337 RepID=A0A3N4JGS1_9PEZI|nr:hypothetical protein L873DRAFT_1812234 [Choiromyces venosus 120613-1]
MSPEIRRKLRAQERKRKLGLRKKAKEFSLKCKADVALIIRTRSGNYSVYLSKDDASWPPSLAEIVSCYPLPEITFPWDPSLRDPKSEGSSTHTEPSAQTHPYASRTPESGTVLPPLITESILPAGWAISKSLQDRG